MKIIFLDCDGVLNSSTWYATARSEDRDMSNHFNHIDPITVELLNKIVEATGAKIVITSVWRKNHLVGEIAHWLRQLGCTGEVLGATPSLPSGIRGEEIQSWLNSSRHGRAMTKMVIIDDSCDMAHLLPHLVRTSHYGGGLQQEHVDEAIRRLTAS